LRRLAQIVLVAVALLGLARWFFRPASPVPPPAVPPAARGPAVAVPVGETPPTARAASSITEENTSHVADALNAADGTIRRDLEILNEVFATFQTNFPATGNPVGENAEITAALTGENKFHFAFIPPGHRAIDAQGELCDRWGTPFRFHQLSGTRMEIRSAGPDRKFGTADDAIFTP